MPLAAPVTGADGVRRLDSGGDVPGVQGASLGSALAGRAGRGSRRTRSTESHGRVTTANADLRRCAREGGTG